MIPEPPSLSFFERLHVRNVYLCVLVEGDRDDGTPCYAYFGMFLDSYLKLLKRLGTQPDMNPKDCGGIVLARSTGSPSREIRQFMRMKFSFADDTQGDAAILEIS